MDRYEEALAKARAEYEKAREQGYTWLMNLLEGMFPDLKESEDERIRRHLIDIVETYWGTTNDPGKAADLAWLEKQKAKDRLDRMAPIYNDKESFESALEKAWKYYNESASRTVDSFEDDYIECVFSKGFREGFLYKEKQKEQKPVRTAKEAWKEMRLEVYAQASGNRHEPNYSNDSTKMFSLCDIDEIFEKIGNSTIGSQPAEWSEEDEKMYARVVRRYTDYEGVIMRTKEESVANKMLNAMAQEEIWLKSLTERFSLQPKQEWSEGDEKMRDRTIARLNWITHNTRTDGTSPNITFFDEIAWLKSLRPQPKQSVSFDTAKSWFEKYFSFRKFKESDYEIFTRDFGSWDELYESFKNEVCGCPQPHWKPSEEQMKEYSYWYRNFIESGLASPSSKAVTVLGELLEQLQKL